MVKVSVMHQLLPERNRLKTTLYSEIGLRRLTPVRTGGLCSPASNEIRWQSQALQLLLAPVHPPS
jgi:hypothetical protein